MKRVIGLLAVVGLLGACAQDRNALQELESLAGGAPHEGHCDGTSNPNVTCDPNTQLEWLDVTVTQGKSIADVESQLGAGGEYAGYRYATLSELDQLLENANVAAEINGYYHSTLTTGTKV